MANEPKQPQSGGAGTELDDLAFQIYAQRMAKQVLTRHGEAEALACYRHAEAFLAARAKVKAGVLQVKKPEGPQLADCCCPKLPKSHPHNLVSQQFGNLEKVNRLHQWLEANPMREDTKEDVVYRFNQTFPELGGWDAPAMNTARAIFPYYCKPAAAK